MIICAQCRTSNRDGTRFCRRCGAFLPVAAPPVEPHDAKPLVEKHEVVPEVEKHEVIAEVEHREAEPEVEKHEVVPEAEHHEVIPEIEQQHEVIPEVEHHEAEPEVEPHGVVAEEHHDDAHTTELHPVVVPLVEDHKAEPEPVLGDKHAEEGSRHTADEPGLKGMGERKGPPIVPVQPPPARTNWRMTAAIAVGAAVVSVWAGYQMAGSGVGQQLTEANAQIRELNIALSVRQKHLEQQAGVVAGLQEELEKARHVVPAETEPAGDQQHLAQDNQILRGQIRQSDTTIARLQERLRRLESGGGRQAIANARTPWGELTWTGDPGPGGVVVGVNGSKAKPGSLQGRLPGLDCTVEPEDAKLVTVVTPPSAPHWDQMAFRVGAGGKKTVVHLRLSCIAK